MRIALPDLQLEHLAVNYPGDRAYPSDDNVALTPLAMIARGSIDALFAARF